MIVRVVLGVALLILVFVVGAAARALILTWTRHGGHEQRELAAEAEADDFIRDLRHGPVAERLATGTDVRRYPSMLPPRDEKPLEPLPAQVPHAAPDTPRACWCGRPAGHVATDLECGDLDEAFSTGQFPAVVA